MRTSDRTIEVPRPPLPVFLIDRSCDTTMPATIVPEHGVRMTCHMLEEVLAAMSNKPLIDDCVPFGQDLLPEKAVQDEPESEEATTK